MKQKFEKNKVKDQDADDEIKLLSQFAEKLKKQNRALKKLLEQNNTKKSNNI